MEQPVSQFKSKSGLKRIFAAFFYSIDGLKSAWNNEHAFRQEVVLAAIGTVIALMLKISAFQKFVLIGVLVLVLIVELLNSALEAVVDRISLEHHPLSKNAKDYGSAAVALTVCLALAAWGLVLFYRFY
ncbi:diacylglycerol kinase [Massilia glaciei]|uniref:Diacylglycerol kinase n=1 Tax=Massilia glaciei TaxID=1524097 RepID=A0A2U2I6U2_9BURK|nr:diacylglycerol kinase [Massilia glaciei]PWF55457.1 diacylglycerol kinase [Massilia glaciei]